MVGSGGPRGSKKRLVDDSQLFMVYELAFTMGRLPSEIRSMSSADFTFLTALAGARKERDELDEAEQLEQGTADLLDEYFGEFQ